MRKKKMRQFCILLSFCCLLSSVFCLDSLASQTGPEKIIQQAQKKEEAGDYEGAQALYESILKHHPDFEPALSGLGQVEYWQGNYQASIGAYAKILEHEPGHIGALIGTGKAYLALGKQRKAQEYFNRAQKINPEEEEIEAIRPQLERKTKLELNGGYITQEMNYATQAQGEYQEIRVSKEKSYGFGLNTTYLRKFGQNGFNTTLFGNYNFFEETRIDLGVNFSTKTSLFPKLGVDAGFAQTLWKITAEVDYNFQKYRQATLHTVRSGLFYEPFEFMKIGGGYEYQNLRFTNNRRNFNGGFGEVRVTPTSWISIYGSYAQIQRGFEAGRTPSPYINYKANVGGGGVVLDFMGGYLIRFDVDYESRNNGETAATYNVSGGYVF